MPASVSKGDETESQSLNEMATERFKLICKVKKPIVSLKRPKRWIIQIVQQEERQLTVSFQSGSSIDRYIQ